MKQLILVLVFSIFGTAIIAQTKISTASGTFTPANVTIKQGKSVEFTTTSNHFVREVSESTYNTGGTTALSGGFTVGTNSVKSISFDLPGVYYYVCPPHAAGGMKGMVTVSGSTGIQNDKLISELSVSPNPTHGDAKLEFSTTKYGKVDVALLNTIGKKIEFFNFTKEYSAGKHSINLNTSELPQGLYFVEIISNGIRTVQRLFVIGN